MIYNDQHKHLKELLASAGMGGNATLLIPDLQRPYVWQPSQVILLIDSLIRGWPFGTLLVWKVGAEDPARDLARAFWRVVDRAEDDGDKIDEKHPPATFQMVLDGQQRIQSLLLALGGDGWGFKLLDRQWYEHLNGIKPRGPRGRPHWSLGCLCVDVPALVTEYGRARRATAIDYSGVLKWVVTDDVRGRSNLPKPVNYIDPLPVASGCGGHYVRFARLWDAAQDNMNNYEAEDVADVILKEHGAPHGERDGFKRAVGDVIIALCEVKKTRVTYLELAEYSQAYGTRDAYNDAIVNIFTRLNTAGRTLTREDITFAWLKIGWNQGASNGRGAKSCMDDLARELGEYSLPLSVEDVISAVSFVWSTSFNDGKLVTNNDLMRGDTIRPMAANVSENWGMVVEAGIAVAAHAKDRGLKFREHYQSVNAVAYLWAWFYLALDWKRSGGLNETAKDEFDKKLAEALDSRMDRWLICSQWAGVWSDSKAVGGFATGLTECRKEFATSATMETALAALSNRLDADIKGLESKAIAYAFTLNADDRSLVRVFSTSLWLWNRLEGERWESAKIALRDGLRRKTAVEVDHVVAFDMWNRKLEALKNSEAAQGADSDQVETMLEDLKQTVNEIGNCMLLEKNFNISKSNESLKRFLDRVYAGDGETVDAASWAKSMSFDMEHVDSSDVPIKQLRAAITARTAAIRSDLEGFIRGTSVRVDLDA